jgi:uncharacterized lipoprotein YddW (UPF0748 family)
MHRLYRLLFLHLLCLSAITAFAQTRRANGTPLAPSTELRGAWIVTVANIDWPSAPNLSPDRQKAEFDSILNVLKAMDFNAVFVQVRPAGDAFYQSTIVPWSAYLTGRQGTPPNPHYDPLEYMVEAAHKRNMELHAWLNPYRATYNLDTASLAPLHPLRALPRQRLSQWFFRYGTRFYFNPANALVIQHLTNVVRDITLRYDVDGIHFDDYFYPYPEQGQVIEDYNEFAADPRGFTNIADWRRDNVNRLIESVSKSIKAVKPYVRFGIGPFGVWRNADRDPAMGSATRSNITCYDDLYADVLLWLRNGWIDYVAPQVYWSVGFAPADYQVLTEWWSRNASGRHVYIGHAAYKIGTDLRDQNWNQPGQIKQQVALNRANPNVRGSIFYSARPLLRNPLGVQDTLLNTLYPKPALVPGMTYLSKTPPASAQFCNVAGSDTSVMLAWNICELTTGDEMPYYFAIYRFPGEGIGDFRDARNLLAVTPFNGEKWTYQDMTAVPGEYYTYVVVGYNRLNVESYSSEPVFVKKTRTGAKKKRKVFGYFFG